MKLLRRLFESKENKLFKYLLEKDNLLEKGFNSLEIKSLREFGMLRCNAKFEIVDGKVIAEFVFSEFELIAGNLSQYTTLFVQKEKEEISISTSGRKLRINKVLLRQVLEKYEGVLGAYQEGQETRYRQFIKALVNGEYTYKEQTVGSQGIEEGKEMVLKTSTGIHLVFFRESQGLLINVKDSEQLYLRSLDYKMDKEAFVNARVRKLSIPADEKEQLITFIKKFIDSKEVSKLFTEEELLLLKINEWGKGNG